MATTEQMPVGLLGFLDLAQVANALPIKGFMDNPTLPVKRLIARGALPAVQVGAGDAAPWTVSLDALKTYIAKGAPDLQPPELSRGWPSAKGAEWRAGKLVADVIEALHTQVPEDARGIPLERNVTPEVRLKITPDIRALIVAPSLDKKPILDSSDPALYADSTGKPLPPKPEWSTFRNIGELYLCERLRLFAQWAAASLDPSRMGGTRFLYSSPDNYQAVVAKAGKDAANGKIVFSRWYPAQFEDGRTTQLQVQFTVADTDVMKAAGTDLATLARLAF